MNMFEKASWDVEKDLYLDDGMSKENCIEFIKNADIATVTFSQGRMVNKLLSLAEKYPDDVEVVHKNRDGSVVAHIPVSYIHLGNYSREFTDEQREASAERMRRLAAERRTLRERTV